MELTKRQRKLYALLKWRFIVQHAPDINDTRDNDDKLEEVDLKMLEHYPFLQNFRHYCSYCDVFYNWHPEKGCLGCPVRIGNNMPCYKEEHPYTVYEFNYTRSTAMAVLEVIKNIKVPNNDRRAAKKSV